MKTNFKLFLTATFILVGVFSLFFISDTKVSAQTIKVETTGYSILSESSFVFGGYYSDNLDKKAFTTYFEFKKDDSNLDDPADREKTIIIRRDTDVDEYGYFYTSPELKLFSDYYFRAVGCFEENPNKDITCSKDDSTKKYYGETLYMRTGYISTFPVGIRYPFTVKKDGIPINNTSSVCTLAQTLVNGVCKDKNQPTCDPKTQILVNGVCKDKTGSNTNTNSDTNSNLVPCGDSADKPCGFYDILKLINNVINYLIKYLAVPIAAIMFAYAGFELVTSGGETSKREKAKKIFINVAIGLIFVAGAFVIIKTILLIAGADTSWDWFGFFK